MKNRSILPRKHTTIDGILAHPDPVFRSLLAQTSAALGLYLMQAADGESACCEQRVLQTPLLVLTASDALSALAGRDRFPNDTAVVALLAPLDTAHTALALLETNAIPVVMAEDAPGPVAHQLLEILARQQSPAPNHRVVLQELAAYEPLPTRDEWSGLLVDEALRRSAGSVSAAARLLGMSRQALHQRLRQRQSEGDPMSTA